MRKCTEVTVRKVSREDFDSVYLIECKSFTYPYPRELLYAYLDMFSETSFVAEACGKVVGYVIAVKRGDSLGHVISIAVDPDYRGIGIGKLLLRRVLDALKGMGCKFVRLEVSVYNKRAFMLYRKFGFRVVCRVKRYYPNGEDAYVMLARL